MTAEARLLAVAGSFYPAGAGQLAATVDELVSAALVAFPPPAGPDSPQFSGVLVPHAGLVYSGVVAAAGWRALLPGSGPSGGGADIVSGRAGLVRGRAGLG